jgi:hypothetical protein
MRNRAEPIDDRDINEIITSAAEIEEISIDDRKILVAALRALHDARRSLSLEELSSRVKIGVVGLSSKRIGQLLIENSTAINSNGRLYVANDRVEPMSLLWRGAHTTK